MTSFRRRRRRQLAVRRLRPPSAHPRATPAADADAHAAIIVFDYPALKHVARMGMPSFKRRLNVFVCFRLFCDCMVYIVSQTLVNVLQRTANVNYRNVTLCYY